MKPTSEWLEENHFVNYGKWWELNVLHLDVPYMDNSIYFSLEHKKIEIGHYSKIDNVPLDIPFTQEAISGFIALYGKTKRECRLKTE